MKIHKRSMSNLKLLVFIVIMALTAYNLQPVFAGLDDRLNLSGPNDTFVSVSNTGTRSYDWESSASTVYKDTPESDSRSKELMKMKGKVFVESLSNAFGDGDATKYALWVEDILCETLPNEDTMQTDGDSVSDAIISDGTGVNVDPTSASDPDLETCSCPDGLDPVSLADPIIVEVTPDGTVSAIESSERDNATSANTKIGIVSLLQHPQLGNNGIHAVELSDNIGLSSSNVTQSKIADNGVKLARNRTTDDFSKVYVGTNLTDGGFQDGVNFNEKTEWTVDSNSDATSTVSSASRMQISQNPNDPEALHIIFDIQNSLKIARQNITQSHISQTGTRVNTNGLTPRESNILPETNAANNENSESVQDVLAGVLVADPDFNAFRLSDALAKSPSDTYLLRDVLQANSPLSSESKQTLYLALAFTKSEEATQILRDQVLQTELQTEDRLHALQALESPLKEDIDEQNQQVFLDLLDDKDLSVRSYAFRANAKTAASETSNKNDQIIERSLTDAYMQSTNEEQPNLYSALLDAGYIPKSIIPPLGYEIVQFGEEGKLVEQPTSTLDTSQSIESDLQKLQTPPGDYCPDSVTDLLKNGRLVWSQGIKCAFNTRDTNGSFSDLLPLTFSMNGDFAVKVNVASDEKGVKSPKLDGTLNAQLMMHHNILGLIKGTNKLASGNFQFTTNPVGTGEVGKDKFVGEITGNANVFGIGFPVKTSIDSCGAIKKKLVDGSIPIAGISKMFMVGPVPVVVTGSAALNYGVDLNLGIIECNTSNLEILVGAELSARASIELSISAGVGFDLRVIGASAGIRIKGNIASTTVRLQAFCNVNFYLASSIISEDPGDDNFIAPISPCIRVTLDLEPFSIQVELYAQAWVCILGKKFDTDYSINLFKYSIDGQKKEILYENCLTIPVYESAKVEVSLTRHGYAYGFSEGDHRADKPLQTVEKRVTLSGGTLASPIIKNIPKLQDKIQFGGENVGESFGNGDYQLKVELLYPLGVKASFPYNEPQGTNGGPDGDDTISFSITDDYKIITPEKQLVLEYAKVPIRDSATVVIDIERDVKEKPQGPNPDNTVIAPKTVTLRNVRTGVAYTHNLGYFDKSTKFEFVSDGPISSDSYEVVVEIGNSPLSWDPLFEPHGTKGGSDGDNTITLQVEDDFDPDTEDLQKTLAYTQKSVPLPQADNGSINVNIWQHEEAEPGRPPHSSDLPIDSVAWKVTLSGGTLKSPLVRSIPANETNSVLFTSNDINKIGDGKYTIEIELIVDKGNGLDLSILFPFADPEGVGDDGKISFVVDQDGNASTVDKDLRLEYSYKG